MACGRAPFAHRQVPTLVADSRAQANRSRSGDRSALRIAARERGTLTARLRIRGGVGDVAVHDQGRHLDRRRGGPVIVMFGGDATQFTHRREVLGPSDLFPPVLDPVRMLGEKLCPDQPAQDRRRRLGTPVCERVAEHPERRSLVLATGLVERGHEHHRDATAPRPRNRLCHDVRTRHR